MRRRELIALFSGAAAWPLAARAQQSIRMRRVGVLMATHEQETEAQTHAALFRQGCGQLGWTEERNIHFDFRWMHEDTTAAKANALELVSQNPDVIVANGTPQLKAVRDATSTIPIVFVVVGDPVGQGFVSSLAHPGGNITGFTAFESAISGKWLELLKEVAPEVERVAFIFNPQVGPFSQKHLQLLEPLAPSLGIRLIVSPIRDTDEIDLAMAAVSGEPKGGVIISPDGFAIGNRSLIISLAAHYRLPAVYAYRAFAADGGLLSYGHDLSEPWRRAPSYVDKILKGASPADLPIQQPTKFEFVINLKTAKTLGLTIPPRLRASADEVIE